MFKVSEVAKKTGLSVRTLHHYEEIGLLPPSMKNEHGHRLYGEDKLFILQQIAVWKDLGFSLKQIGQLLDLKNPEQAVEEQLSQLEREEARIREMKQQLTSLKNIIAIEQKLDWDILFSLISESSTAEKHRAEYVDMLSHLPALGGKDDISREWVGILQAFNSHFKSQTPYDDPSLQKLCKMIIDKSAELFEGDEQKQQEFWKIRKSPEKSARLNLYPIAPPLLEYIQEAITAFERGLSPHNFV
ncbi:MerR family transcriptional regulator [Bacillus sp. H-16]|uniref:MerR family transcriptional regulator n=1 Tax=Alteribacter salitolerans TaxID=2912333 RepID=UPI0019626D0E|nr:MerR family transcriptional regulator [Alteribacter salitolerans]MBM7095465.1 MerR family transcriptional regulator [Alteribacter salitolerans]